MDFNLSEQEKMLKEAARDFSLKSILPRASEIDQGKFPLDLLKELGKLGYAGLPFPTQYGGSGAGYVSFALVLEQICQASMSVGAMMSVNLTPAEAVLKYGNEEQKNRFITPIAQGKAFGCIAFTEAETGSDPREITSTCRKSGNKYILNGHKQFVCNAPGANYALVFTKSESEGLNAFILETSTPGFKIESTCDTLGVRGAGTSVVFLDDAEVPQENLLGKPGQGFDILLEAISVERLYVGIQALGIAQSALDVAISYAKQRKAMGKPISKLLSIQWHIAEMATRIEAARWMAYRTAFIRDQGKDIKYETAMLKLFASQSAVAVTDMGMQVTGAYGAMRSMPIERLYRDAKITEIYVGIDEVQRVIVANTLINKTI
jgi:alkylation response protein AidB-like acyl-CoA dehydrogenase